jgi:hypothetical protein
MATPEHFGRRRSRGPVAAGTVSDLWEGIDA